MELKQIEQQAKAMDDFTTGYKAALQWIAQQLVAEQKKAETPAE